MNENYLVQLIEDSVDLVRVNKETLEMEGYQVIYSYSLEDARKKLIYHQPDIIILDIMLPDGSGIDFCREIREFSIVPVIFLTDLDEKKIIINGLKSGGNDLIAKPYDLDELVARVEAFLRLQAGNKMNTTERFYRMGCMSFDLQSRQLFADEREIVLTPKEFSVLLFLTQHIGQKFTAEEIYREIWGRETLGDIRTVHVRISSLRKKLSLILHNNVYIESLERKYYYIIFNE